ncbi:MAG: hypothetical protein FWC32_06105 [Firmicutes bacterium]|nr:hypothetical protein [Bacillota bacterium]
MIDFKDEIGKYKPVRTVDEVEEGIKDEIHDILELLQYISDKASIYDGGRL